MLDKLDEEIMGVCYWVPDFKLRGLEIDRFLNKDSHNKLTM